MATISICNQTPARITLVSVDGKKITLAPLQQKAVAEDSSFYFDDLEHQGIVSQDKDTPDEISERMVPATLGVGFWLGVIGVVIANRKPFFNLDVELWPWIVAGSGALLLGIVLLVLYLTGTNSVSRAIRWSLQAISLTVILAVGVGLPAATIYYFGGGQQMLSGPDPVNPSSSGKVAAAAQTGSEETGDTEQQVKADKNRTEVGSSSDLPFAIYGRLIQLAFIAIASLLPVLLFFLFDRYCLGTLRKRLYISLFRLDRTLKTTGEIDAKYGAQIDEAFGPQDFDQGRLSPGTRWPVLVCALVMTIGWTVAIAPVGDFSPETGHDVISALLPQPTALVFGFLGVYFYSLGLIALRYARGDLKPKAYTQIMVRIFIVAVLSWVLETIYPGDRDTKLLLAFLFGITPASFFIWLREAFRGTVPASIIPQPTLPLQELEGIDLYDHGRLESEGIVNIESLAHHELIDLIIETRIAVPRLVDWIDQAILYLHLIGGSDPDARKTLRDYGIRTATDLELAWSMAEKRGPESLAGLKKLLGGDAPLYRLEVIRDALSDDEWMETVTNWRDEGSRDEATYDAFPTTAVALKKLAEQELADGRYRHAFEYFIRSITEQDTAVARRRLAWLLAQSDNSEIYDPDAARGHVEQAFALAPDSYIGYIESFDVYLALGDTDKAKEMLTEADRIVDGWDKSRSHQKKSETQRLADLEARLELVRRGPNQAE